MAYYRNPVAVFDNAEQIEDIQIIRWYLLNRVSLIYPKGNRLSEKKSKPAGANEFVPRPALNP